ncbi:bifunctional UDP-sugar hydrolase/5'-nucleotidase [Metasolibacillus sp. FSL H7-0170]|uniref:bifunctional metallophosphatase/5'-nucleotidase n=1 Tax=Metasolibacillus sp. FSL H7-0170 TaxID=2921431 RepID=UPI003159790E
MKKISVLVTSDIHGYVMPTDFSNKSVLPMGLGKLMTIIEEERKRSAVLLIDNGDFIQGSPMTYYEQKVDPHYHNQMIKVANAMQYDAAIFGNHEFNYGLHTVKTIVEQSQFPWLAANIKDERGHYFTQPSMIKEIEGIKIAVVGITTQFVPYWEAPAHIAGLIFEDAFTSAQQEIANLREKFAIDVMIVAYHGGFEADLQTGERLEESRENIGYQLCQEIEGVDVVITGHQHRELALHLFGKAVVQSGTKGICLGKVELLFNNEGILQRTSSSLIYLDETIPLNVEIENIITPLYEKTEKWLDQRIGKITGSLAIHDTFEARLKGHSYVELVNRVQMEVTGASISCASIFNDTCAGFQNDVTMRDIVTNYIYPNTLKVLSVEGRYIVAALEQSATYFTMENDKPTISEAFKYPKEQPYNYDLWSGIDYTIDLTKPAGQRVVSVFFQGQPLQLSQHYHVVMNSYRATGAGNFDYFKTCPVVKDIQTDMTELLADYFTKHGTVEAKPMTNMRMIYRN